MSESNLRIAIIDPVGEKAGLDHYDISLAKALSKQDCSVKIFSNFDDLTTNNTNNTNNTNTTNSANDTNATNGTNSKKILVEKQFRFTFRKNIFQKIRTGICFIKALNKARRFSAEIIILHLFHSSLADYILISLTKKFGFRICLILHDVESFIHGSENPDSFRDRLNDCLRKADKIIVHNVTTFDDLRKKIDGLTEKVHIIPHGNYNDHPPKIHRELITEYFNLDQSKKFLLFFGMIKKSKGLEVILKAMKMIDENFHLIIAGRVRDESFSHYEKIIQQEGIREKVYPIIRYLTNTERHYLFSLADITVLPYHRIYQSGVMLMSMGYGIPVVASNLPANREIINDKTGILFAAGDSKDLALKINLLINDPVKRNSIGKNAIDYMTQNHDWDKIAEKFIKLLKNR